jgi:hypothetical protein
MLVTKEVEINITHNNYKHYQDLGYDIKMFINKKGKSSPRRQKIVVKVEDLSPTSSVNVEICCDACQRLKTVQYIRYYNHNHNGRTYCIHCYAKVFASGENSRLWNFNLTQKERELGRTYPTYFNFVRKVKARDKETCYCCGKKDCNTEIHHLNGYNWYIEGRVDELNAVTLCPNCHKNFHLLYGKGNNTKEQFEEWIGHAVNNLEKYDKELPTARKIYCIEQNKVYHSAVQIEKILNIKKTNIYSICNQKGSNKSAKGLHFLWLDEYEKMNKNDILNYLERCDSEHNRKIICTTTNKIFKKITDGAREYGISSTNIRHAINHDNGQKYAGKLDNGTPLEWMYYKEWKRKQCLLDVI